MIYSRRQFLNMIGYSSASLLAVTPAVGNAETSSVDASNCLPVPRVKANNTGPHKKFDLNGKVQRYPGNTVICHIPRPSKVFDEMVAAYAEFRANTGDHNVTFLPASSYHMTVFDGVTDEQRRPGDWPHGLPLDASMEACNNYVAEKLRGLKLQPMAPFRMVIDETPAYQSRFSIRLRGMNDAETRRLYELRDIISKAIGVRHANHDGYEFHTTFGYYVRQFSESEEKAYQANFQKLLRQLKKTIPVIELQAPEYCLFNDMAEFRPQFLLGSDS